MRVGPHYRRPLPCGARSAIKSIRGDRATRELAGTAGHVVRGSVEPVARPVPSAVRLPRPFARGGESLERPGASRRRTRRRGEAGIAPAPELPEVRACGGGGAVDLGLAGARSAPRSADA